MDYKEIKRLTFESTGNSIELIQEEYSELMNFAASMQPVEDYQAALFKLYESWNNRNDPLRKCDFAHVIDEQIMSFSDRGW